MPANRLAQSAGRQILARYVSAGNSSYVEESGRTAPKRVWLDRYISPWITMGINYRKLAFEKYAPICVVCGFGIREILEVAHLDGNHGNCELSNLAILCPNCHKMHDVDLISTAIVLKMRDEKRKVNWTKRIKDAGRKAAETRRKNELSAIAKKAVATRRKNQKQAFSTVTGK